MRLSWVHPEVAERIRAQLHEGRASWEDVFRPDADAIDAGEPPDGIQLPSEEWPRLAEHIARVERVREVVARRGIAAAEQRFAASPHAVERAVIVAEQGGQDITAIAGLLACRIDEWVAYGEFLSRLVELGIAADPAGTVQAFERFVVAARAIDGRYATWRERVRMARDGLAALYVRVGRSDDAETLYRERYDEEPTDTTVPIGAARAFLEAGNTARSVAWLGLAAERAATIGRDELAARLIRKATTLRARIN